MLSRKYYIEFATMIRNVKKQDNIKSKEDTILFIIDYLLDLFQKDNPGFMIDKFLAEIAKNL